jgi:hypothetical protein
VSAPAFSQVSQGPSNRGALIDPHDTPILGKQPGVSAMEIEESLKAQRPA